MSKTTHGLSSKNNRHPLYGTWAAMWNRCRSPKHDHYHRYGGRGITVCEKWKDFAAFVADVGPKPSPADTLDRIDNDGHYEPGNVRWANKKDQSRNSLSARYITANGVTRCLTEWANVSGLSMGAIWGRLNKKWCDECSVSLPPRQKCKHRRASDRERNNEEELRKNRLRGVIQILRSGSRRANGRVVSQGRRIVLQRGRGSANYQSR